MNNLNVCLLNDSFPPIVDGVSNAVINYAKNLQDFGDLPFVVTPAHASADDSSFSFPVIRYPGINLKKTGGYVAGVPFSPETAKIISETPVSVYHTHCPIISTFMARQLRQINSAPIILTYHTKFDIDIENVIKNKKLQKACITALIHNINACDEVWTVSHGAGENLRKLGYLKNYIVMPNGVDIPFGRVNDETIIKATGNFDLPEDIPVYLFVGRLMWYKGIKIIIDALSALSKQGKDFRMVFIGDGSDRAEIERYVNESGLGKKTIFTGLLKNRDDLRAWYCRANLFLFPSTFDTNGLVVREAAACNLPSVLIRGSAAAEGTADNQNSFHIDENPASLCECLSSIYSCEDKIHNIGNAAGRELYFPWSEAVHVAKKRYETVIERHAHGLYAEYKRPSENIIKISADLMNAFAKLTEFKQ